MKALNKLGVPAQFVDANESYMAMRTGVVDGGAYSLLWALKTSIYEVTKYYSRLYPYSAAVMPGIGVSKKAWAKLPDDLKTVWEKVAKGLLWDAMHEKWITLAYDISAAKSLKEKGMISDCPL